MHRVFSIYLFVAGPVTWAQNAAPESPSLSSLMTEVHELRLAIERSTLLGARTQIAIQRLQMQEGRVASAAKALEDARKEVGRAQSEHADLALVLKDLDRRLSQAATPGAKGEIESQIQSIKQRAADGSGEAQARAKEAEAFGQFQNEQSRLDQLNAEISQIEQALDAAIRQITGGR